MINVSHASVLCKNFTNGNGTQERTVVIGPIRIFENKKAGETVYDLVIGCNLYQGCCCEGCGYSHTARAARKKES